MNVFEKINEVKKTIGGFSKDRETTGSGSYKYTSGNQILGAIKSKMEEIGLLFLPVGTEHRGYETYDYKNSFGKDKTDFIVNGKITYEWINVEEPTDRQRVSFEYYGQQNDISKAFGSGLTYSERYLLLKSLGVPTDEDEPDAKNEEKIKEDKNKKETLKPTTQKPQNKASTPQSKSKWVIINNMIKDSEITLASVNEWIKKSYKSNIKINDLTEEQFTKLLGALNKQLGGEECE